MTRPPDTPPAQTEGVVKYRLDFRPGPAPAAERLGELNAWRRIFRALGLLGQTPARYDGLGFGNLSRRLPGEQSTAFLISGTQTGGAADLAADQYVTVTGCDPRNNRLIATGTIHPSSEALSHGVLYNAFPTVNWVMHLHSPEIFAARKPLALPTTDPAALYGTPEMAAEIERLVAPEADAGAGLIVMGGHADGILAFGRSADRTGCRVVAALAEALALPT